VPNPDGTPTAAELTVAHTPMAHAAKAYLLRQEVEAQYEPWRMDVRHVSATMLECRACLANAGVKYTTTNLLEMTRLALEFGGRVGKIGR
jgi:hypothetical protein